MSSSERYAQLARRSLTEHGVAVTLDWRHEAFFDWLQLSPSYRIAHELALGTRASGAAQPPHDIAAVQRTYEAFGDVYETYFSEWWFRRAQYQFGVKTGPRPKVVFRIDKAAMSANSDDLDARKADAWKKAEAQHIAAMGAPTLMLSVPVQGDRRLALRKIAALLRIEFDKESVSPPRAAYAFLPRGVRERTLAKIKRVLLFRIGEYDLRIFEVGNKAKVAQSYWTDPSRPRSLGQEEKRRLMEITVSRDLRKALLVAENAARGAFPSDAKLPGVSHDLSFDYRALHEQFKKYLLWGKRRSAELQKQKAEREKLGKATKENR